MTNEKITEILDRCKGRFGWVQIHMDTEENYLLMPLADLVELLEKQVPKKPEEYEDKFYACPICGNVLLHKWKKYNTELMDKSNGLPYCLNCGQKLDWSDEE